MKERTIFDLWEQFDKFPNKPVEPTQPKETLPPNPDTDLNMETETMLSQTSKKVEQLFKDALQDIKIQVEAPKGHILVREPPQPDQEYTLEEDLEEFPPKDNILGGSE
jgi:GTPase SAR1 family protein